MITNRIHEIRSCHLTFCRLNFLDYRLSGFLSNSVCNLLQTILKRKMSFVELRILLSIDTSFIFRSFCLFESGFSIAFDIPSLNLKTTEFSIKFRIYIRFDSTFNLILLSRLQLLAIILFCCLSQWSNQGRTELLCHLLKFGILLINRLICHLK